MKAIVTGAANGLGRAIADELKSNFIFDQVIRLDRQGGDDVIPYNVKSKNRPTSDYVHNKLGGELHFLINCAGINRNEWFESVSRESFDELMHTNAYAIVNMAQQFMSELIVSKGCIINIVSNAAHIPMTSSLAYNASKAAALMITRQMAHELTPRHGLTVFSISPNKLSGTRMSAQIERDVQRVRGWTAEYAREYQKRSLMHGQETDPAAIASFINGLINTGNWKYLSGCDIPFGK
jgi:NAD(P)-dependent dehydrogenase (short-subunit alcohol dehydrogenase family)